MASDRAKLVLDEQSFQGLLAAAFTIQEHNTRMNSAEPPAAPADVPRPKEAASPEVQSAPSACNQCGTPLPALNASCPNCSMPSFRPGERLQRNWASLWQMSQEQGGGLDAHKKPGDDLPLSPADPGRLRPDPGDFRHAARSVIEPAISSVPANGHTVGMQAAAEVHGPASSAADRATGPLNGECSHELSHERTNLDGPTKSDESRSLDESATLHESPAWDEPADVTTDEAPAEALAVHHEPWSDDSTLDESEPAPDTADQPARRRLGLHFQRADLYLGFAIVFAAAVLLWPAAGSDQKPKLPLWERAFIAIGIAEAPQPVAHHFHGDPDMKVWIDTHTALYYCPGDELYGKSPDGHYSTQREAQADRFEPAERSVCIE
ncbi:MAG: hypothetical protein WAL71_21340 [Terriglobales bacterium]|jgi:hypothetical protein